MNKNSALLGLLFLAIAVGVFLSFHSGAYAMHKAPDSATGEQQAQPEADQSFNQLIQERDIARDRARDRLLQRAGPAGDASVTVKVRRRGENTDPGSRGDVIAEMKVSKDEAAKASTKELYTKVKTNAGSTVVSRPEATPRTSRRERFFEATERERTAVWIMAGVIGLGLAGWWYIRRFQPV